MSCTVPVIRSAVPLTSRTTSPLQCTQRKAPREGWIRYSWSKRSPSSTEARSASATRTRSSASDEGEQHRRVARERALGQRERAVDLGRPGDLAGDHAPVPDPDAAGGERLLERLLRAGAAAGSRTGAASSPRSGSRRPRRAARRRPSRRSGRCRCASRGRGASARRRGCGGSSRACARSPSSSSWTWQSALRPRKTSSSTSGNTRPMREPDALLSKSSCGSPGAGASRDGSDVTVGSSSSASAPEGWDCSAGSAIFTGQAA